MNQPIEILNRVTNTSVQKHTKKDWNTWVALLEKAGAKHWTHQEIVAYLKKKYKVTAWWQQIITSGFETHIGRRAEGRNAKGLFSVTATKTFHTDSKTLWKFLASPQGIAIWLKPLAPTPLHVKQSFETESGAFGEIRTMKAGERIRMTWQEEDWSRKSTLQLFIVSRANGTCILAISQDSLEDGRLREPLRTYWKDILTEIVEQLPKTQSSESRSKPRASASQKEAISEQKSLKRRGSRPRKS